MAEEGERLRLRCQLDCIDGCQLRDDCWSIEPEVREGNKRAWFLYQLFDAKWEWGAAGYRSRYDSTELMQMARWFGAEAMEMLDMAERVKVIENTILEIEGQRYEADKEKRDREDRMARLAQGVK